jgi:hypothetical protein
MAPRSSHRSADRAPLPAECAVDRCSLVHWPGWARTPVQTLRFRTMHRLCCPLRCAGTWVSEGAHQRRQRCAGARRSREREVLAADGSGPSAPPGCDDDRVALPGVAGSSPCVAVGSPRRASTRAFQNCRPSGCPPGALKPCICRDLFLSFFPPSRRGRGAACCSAPGPNSDRCFEGGRKQRSLFFTWVGTAIAVRTGSRTAGRPTAPLSDARIVGNWG